MIESVLGKNCTIFRFVKPGVVLKIIWWLIQFVFSIVKFKTKYWTHPKQSLLLVKPLICHHASNNPHQDNRAPYYGNVSHFCLWCNRAHTLFTYHGTQTHTIKIKGSWPSFKQLHPINMWNFPFKTVVMATHLKST